MVIYDLTVKTARMEAVRDSVAGGTIEVLSATDSVLAVFDLTVTGGTASGATWTMAVDSTTVQGLPAAGAGTVATKVQIKNAGGTVLISGLVVGEDVELSNPNIAEDQDITFVSGAITHAPDPA